MLRSSTVHARAIVAAALAFGLVLALAAPAWAAPSLSIDSGPSGPTNDATPLFGFTVDLGAMVECSIDQGTPDFGLCSGISSHEPDDELADGEYVFRVRATDVILMEQTEASRAFSVDTAAPAVDIASGPGGPTNDPTPSFGFTAEAGATVECSVDQGTPDFGPCTAGASHTAAPLSDGSYTFRVRAIDAAGNRATASRSFSVDTVPPPLSIGSGPSGPTNDPTPSFGFTSGGATVECSIDQGTPAYGPCAGGSTHGAGAPLPDGGYVFRVRATDAAGNQAVAERSFSIDATPPVLTIDSGPAGPTNDATPSFGFTVDGTATTVECSIDQGTPAYGSCTGPGSHTAVAALSDGAYAFRVRATDVLGNRATVTQPFSVDSSAPSLTIDSGPAGPTNDAAPSFGFSTDGVAVECSIDQGTPAYGPCTSATTHAVAAALPDGTHTFRVRATNGLGTHAISARTFTIDTAPPALSIGFGPSGTTSDSTPLFGFAAEAGATAECSIDQGTPAYGPCASATTHAAIAPLADGAYVFRVQATDGVGNQAVATRAFTVDTVPDTIVPPSPRPDPTPPATSRSSAPRLMSPFPLVRISGTLIPAGARIRLLTVRASRGALVRVTVSPACSRARRASRRCRVLKAAGTVGRSAVLRFRGLARVFPSGTVIVVRVWSPGRIGKYTRFTIVRGKAPRRVDQCLVPEATRGSRCPSV